MKLSNNISRYSSKIVSVTHMLLSDKQHLTLPPVQPSVIEIKRPQRIARKTRNTQITPAKPREKHQTLNRAQLPDSARGRSSAQQTHSSIETHSNVWIFLSYLRHLYTKKSILLKLLFTINSPRGPNLNLIQ